MCYHLQIIIHDQPTFSGSFTNHFVPTFLESSESIVKFPVKSHAITDLSLEPIIILNINCRETNHKFFGNAEEYYLSLTSFRHVKKRSKLRIYYDRRLSP